MKATGLSETLEISFLPHGIIIPKQDKTTIKSP
jgi:hypothetical protein